MQLQSWLCFSKPHRRYDANDIYLLSIKYEELVAMSYSEILRIVKGERASPTVKDDQRSVSRAVNRQLSLMPHM